jgi:predicted dehydrogenase
MFTRLRSFNPPLGVAAGPFIVPRRRSVRTTVCASGGSVLGRIAQATTCRASSSPARGLRAGLRSRCKRIADSVKIVRSRTRTRGSKAPQIRTFDNYRELIARRDIDAVVISTPDHWHARWRWRPVNAGKDVYLRPFTMTHAEGVILRDAVKRHGRILQVGSQQRSWEQFRRAAELIRSGRIGNVQRVEIGLPTDPTAADAAPEPVPANLDFGQWLGPTPVKYYTEMRVHPREGYSRPGWLRHEAHCLGMITGWGSHHYDTMHWALQFEEHGPSREGRASSPIQTHLERAGAYDVTLQYPKGRGRQRFGQAQHGSQVLRRRGLAVGDARGTGATSAIRRPKGANLPPLDASDRRSSTRAEFPAVAGEQIPSQELAPGVVSRKPLAPAGVAHRSKACIVGWIAMKLGRPLSGIRDRDVQERRRSQRDADPQRTLALRRAAPEVGTGLSLSPCTDPEPGSTQVLPGGANCNPIAVNTAPGRCMNLASSVKRNRQSLP